MLAAAIKAECERIWNRPGVSQFNRKAAWVINPVGWLDSEPIICKGRGAIAPGPVAAERKRLANLRRLVETHKRKA